MHAVVVKVTIEDFEPAREFLTNEIVPRVSQAPGFVAGYWTRSGENTGQSMIVFESEDSAQTVKQMLESGDGPGEAVTLESAEVCEVVASA
jgi:hypothetical protein